MRIMSGYEHTNRKRRRRRRRRVQNSPIASTHIPSELRRKLEKKSIKGYFVGYHDGLGGYRVYLPEKCDVVVSRDVTFKEETLNSSISVCKNKINVSELMEDIPKQNTDDDIQQGEEAEQQPEMHEPEESDHVESADESEFMPTESEEEMVDDNPIRVINLRDRSRLRKPDYFQHHAMLAAIEKEPKSYEEAISCPDADKWRSAMDDEINSLLENDTWVLVEKPENAKVIDNKWVYRLKKKNQNGASEVYKARLVI